MGTATLQSPRDAKATNRSWPDIVASRGNAIVEGRLYRADFAKSPAVGMVTSGEVRTDPIGLSAEADLTTPRQDLEGDVINPLGVHYDDYVKNPVVLWEHGFGSIDTPIAKAEHPNGMLALSANESGILCRSYFSAKDRASMQIFALIDDELIRAMSIRTAPLDHTVRVIPFKSGEHGLFVGESQLREASWCKMGMNPDAVAKCCRIGSINGERIDRDLLKSLQSQFVPRIMSGRGFSLTKSEGAMGYDDEDETTKETTDETTNAQGDESNAGTESTSDDESAEDQSLKAPYGSQYLQAHHSVMKDHLANMEAGYGLLEQEDVRELVTSQLGILKDMILQAEGLHDEKYSEQVEPLKPAESSSDSEGGGGDASTKDDEEKEKSARLKSFLSKRTNRLTIRGYATRAKSVASNRNLSKSERQLLNEMADRLIGLEREAEKAEQGEMMKRLDSVEQTQTTIMKRLDDILPYRA